MQRVRNRDELAYSEMRGYTKYPNVTRVYRTTNDRVLGRKQVIVDYPKPLRDYRYDFIPVIKTRVYKRRKYLPSTYKGKRKIVSHGKVVKYTIVRNYTKFIRLKRPPKSVAGSEQLVRMNDVQIAEVRGFCSRGVVKTPSLPPGWTTWYMEGTPASEGMKNSEIQYEVGFTLHDLSRPLELDTVYAQVALARAMAKVSAPDVDFAEIVGELEQTTKLASDPFKTLGGLLRKFQRYSSADAWICKPRSLPQLGNRLATGNLKRLAYSALDVPTLLSGPLAIFGFRTRRKVGRRKISNTMITEAANRWLQYRYGIAPLMSDITTAFERVQTLVARLVQVRMVKATVVSGRRNRTWEWTAASSIPGFTHTYRITCSIFDRTTAKVYFRLKLADDYVNLRDLGCDSSNIIPVIHELGRWSFVVDWFYGIESWLRSWNQDPSLQILGNCVSRKRDVNVRIEIVATTYQGYPCQVPNSKHYSHRRELCRKVNMDAPPYPVLNPDFLKWRRCLDTVSLLWAKAMPALRR